MLRFPFALAFTGLCALFRPVRLHFSGQWNPGCAPRIVRYEGARVHSEAGAVIDNGHVVVRRGRIEGWIGSLHNDGTRRAA